MHTKKGRGLGDSNAAVKCKSLGSTSNTTRLNKDKSEDAQIVNILMAKWVQSQHCKNKIKIKNVKLPMVILN